MRGSCQGAGHGTAGDCFSWVLFPAGIPGLGYGLVKAACGITDGFKYTPEKNTNHNSRMKVLFHLPQLWQNYVPC